MRFRKSGESGLFAFFGPCLDERMNQKKASLTRGERAILRSLTTIANTFMNELFANPFLMPWSYTPILTFSPKYFNGPASGHTVSVCPGILELNLSLLVSLI